MAIVLREISNELDREGSLGLRLLLFFSVTLVTGSLIAAAFLLPLTVGSLISGQALIALALTFVGAGLSLLVAIPPPTTGNAGKKVDVESPEGMTPQSGRQYGLDKSMRERILAVHGLVDMRVSVPVIVVSVGSFCALLFAPEWSATMVEVIETFVLQTARPLLHGAMFVFVVSVLWLAVGSSGRIRLGGSDATPEYSDPVYVAMIFSTGIAAGIVFWGPAEVLFHYETVPPFFDVEPQSEAAVVNALQTVLFHWGITAWSAYLIVGLPVAYAVYNLGAPFRISSMLVPLAGTDIVETIPGKVVDTLAVLATIGGLSTTLGFLAPQFLTGIEFRWGVQLDSTAQLLFVAGITLLVVVSVVADLRQGIRRLSMLNTSVFATMLVGIALVGPTLVILETGIQAVGGYLLEFLPMSLYTGGSGASTLPGVSGVPSDGWLEGWTSFYWAWWLSWAPFVGLFIARISRGRTIRTVVLAAGVVTSLMTMIWFLVFGATALSIQQQGRADLVGVVDEFGAAVAGYPLLDVLAFGDVLVVLFLLLVITFFVTSAGAATRSLAMMTANTNDPPPLHRFVLALSIGLVAICLLLFADGSLLETAAVVTGGPFAILGLLALAGLISSVRDRSED